MKFELKHITTEVCPHCLTTRIKSARVENLHTCGDWNEYLEFDCGYTLHFSPNFQRTEPNKKCITQLPWCKCGCGKRVWRDDKLFYDGDCAEAWAANKITGDKQR